MRAVWTLAFLLVLASADARAQGGLNLAWDECVAGGGSHYKSFGCNTNTGPAFLLQLSLVVPTRVAHLAGASVEVGTCMGGVPAPWWQTLAGQCRVNALSLTFDPSANSTSCPDLWQGNLVFQAFRIEQSSVGVRVYAEAALPAGVELDVPADGTEYYLGRIQISRSKTTGMESCPGCASQVGIALDYVVLRQPAGMGTYTLTQPATMNWASWNGGDVSLCSVPTRNRTWGEIKSLYR